MSRVNYSYTADAFRIIAILAVVTIHISTSFVNYPPYFHGVSWWFANLVDSACRIAVPVFIMLSGALLLDMRKAETHTVYFRKRLKRVGIPLLVWSILYLLWQEFFWGKQLTAKQVFTDALSPYIYYHLYFLYIILGLYILVPFFRVLLRQFTKKQQEKTLIFLFFLVGTIYALNVLVPDLRVTFNGLTLFLPYTPYFLAGHFFWQKKITKNRFFVYGGVFCLLTILTAVLNFYQMVFLGWTNHMTASMDYERYFYDHFSPNVILMSLLGFMILQNIPTHFSHTKNSINKKGILFFAPIVFGVYLIHPMIIDILERYFPVFALPNIAEITAPFMMVAKIIVVTAISFVLVFLGSRIKYLNNIFG